MPIFLLQVGFLGPEPFATELSITPIIKFSCTEPNVGLQSGAQHHTDFYLKWLVHSTGQGDLHLLIVKENLLSSSLHEKRQISWVVKYRSSLQYNYVKLLQNGSYFIKLDILVMPFGQSRSGYGLNFSGFILMIFSLCEMYSPKQFCWLNIEHPATATHLHDAKWHCTDVVVMY